MGNHKHFHLAEVKAWSLREVDEGWVMMGHRDSITPQAPGNHCKFEVGGNMIFIYGSFLKYLLSYPSNVWHWDMGVYGTLRIPAFSPAGKADVE